MKGTLRFFARHILSTSVFVAAIVAAFVYGWPLLLIGLLLAALFFCIEWLYRMILYRPTKKDMETFRAEHPTFIEGARKTKPSEWGWW